MTNDELALRRNAIEHRIRLSVRYHQCRVRFFDLADLWTKAISALFGTAALSSLMAGTGLLLSISAAVVSVTSILALVFGHAVKARLHQDFVRRYLELEGELVTQDGDERAIINLDKSIRLIEAQEPPPLGALIVMCQNELFVQDGENEYIVPVPWYKKALSQFIDFAAPVPSKRQPIP